MRIWFPFMTAISSFGDLYRDRIGSHGALDAYRLLQGFENKTVQSGRALWQVSRTALAMPAVRKVLEERAAADMTAALGETPEGRGFLLELQGYLSAWGNGATARAG